MADGVDELRLIVPPGTEPWLRVHPLLQESPGVIAEFADAELRLSIREGGKEGRAGLLRVASGLAAAAPLRLCLRTGAPRLAGALGLRPHQTLAEAMRAVLRECQAHLLENVTLAAAGEIEGVHQARVALRRLRAAMLMFRPRLDRAAADPLDGRLQDLGRTLGAARDWDVFLHETFPALEAAFSDEGPWLARLRTAACIAHEATHREVVAVLGGAGFTQLVLELGRWIEDGPAGEHGRRTLAHAVPPLLDRMLERSSRRGRHVAQAPMAELHAFRKSLKKLRYGLEFVEAIYGHKPVKRYLHHLKDLQSRLGTVNDGRVTLELIGGLGSRGRLDAAPAFGRVATWSDSAAAAALGEIAPLWAALRASEVPWRR